MLLLFLQQTYKGSLRNVLSKIKRCRHHQPNRKICSYDDGQVLSTDNTITQLLKTALTTRYGQLVWHDQTSKHTGTNITRYPNGAVKLDLKAVAKLPKYVEKCMDAAYLPAAVGSMQSLSSNVCFIPMPSFFCCC